MNPNLLPPTPSPNLDGCCVVLVRTQGPINLGMVARICTNIGITDLRFCNPQCGIDVPEARMFSTHGKDLLLGAPVFADLASATADCGLVIGSSARFRDGELGAGLRPQEVPAYLRQRPAAKWALVFGNEADGLTDGELINCQGWVHLDTFGPNTSYNLSHAVAITLYQLATCGQTIAPAGEPAARREAVAHLYQYWLSTLERFQYFRRTERERFAPQLQRLFNRLDLSDHDVQVLWGMLAQFQLFAFGDRGLETL
jgi:tRNA/rRNA methyltransferase